MEESKKQGIQSIEIGVQILQLVAAAEKPITITELAELCQTSKSKLYRYLNSFVRTGFLEKDKDTKYVLGKEILRLGLKASHEFKIVDIAHPYLMTLKEKFNETSALAAFGENGPFFVSWEESTGPINIGIKVGSNVGLTESASGKLFVAHLPEYLTESLIIKELRDDQQLIKDFKNSLSIIHENGYSFTDGTIVPGISAIAAPIFDRNKLMVASISIVGLTNSINTSPDSEIVNELKKHGMQISRELGWIG